MRSLLILCLLGVAWSLDYSLQNTLDGIPVEGGAVNLTLRNNRADENYFLAEAEFPINDKNTTQYSLTFAIANEDHENLMVTFTPGKSPSLILATLNPSKCHVFKLIRHSLPCISEEHQNLNTKIITLTIPNKYLPVKGDQKTSLSVFVIKSESQKPIYEDLFGDKKQNTSHLNVCKIYKYFNVDSITGGLTRNELSIFWIQSINRNFSNELLVNIKNNTDVWTDKVTFSMAKKEGSLEMMMQGPLSVGPTVIKDFGIVLTNAKHEMAQVNVNPLNTTDQEFWAKKTQAITKEFINAGITQKVIVTQTSWEAITYIPLNRFPPNISRRLVYSSFTDDKFNYHSILGEKMAIIPVDHSIRIDPSSFPLFDFDLLLGEDHPSTHSDFWKIVYGDENVNKVNKKETS